MAAIEGMNTEVKELVQRDASVNGGDEIEPMLASVNLVPIVEPLISPLSAPMTTGPTPFTWLVGIPEAEEEIASVKDFVTSGLLVQGHGDGVEASGSSRRPMTSEFKFAGSFMVGDGALRM